jgi:predicted dehydrogenase
VAASSNDEGEVRLGIIGLGNIGQAHAELVQSRQVDRVKLAAVSSRTPDSSYDAPHFSDYSELLRSGLVDAVLIATPTLLHPEMGRLACEHGLHVLMEKPLAMSVGQAQEMLAHRQPNQKFGVMLNQRFHPSYAKLKSMIDQGAIGDVTRVSWTMTAWYRPDVYYQVSTWRGTWPGEGGGLLINQCIHNLDVLQWLTGLPANVSAIAGFGRHHNIDVEDEFTATLSYASGATGVIVASSGEAPGINQLDIVGDRGMLRFDGETLSHWRSDVSVREHCQTTNEMFGMPNFEVQTVGEDERLSGKSQHAQVLQNFVDAILDDIPLTTPAEEGLASLHLANGILQSAWNGAPVKLPVDTKRFERALQQRISKSTLRSPSSQDVQINMDKSFR